MTKKPSILRTLVKILPPGRLRERYQRELNALSECLTVAEAELVVLQHHLTGHPEAAEELDTEIHRAEARVSRLRNRMQRQVETQGDTA